MTVPVGSCSRMVPGTLRATPPTPDETPRPTSISGRKVWVDDSNAHNTRPASITVELLANGEVVDSKTVTGKSDRWSYSFTGLDRTDDNGNTITYTVREVEVSGYTTTVSGTTITNELIPRTTEEYTSLNGIKTWVDNNNADGNLAVNTAIMAGEWEISPSKRVWPCSACPAEVARFSAPFSFFSALFRHATMSSTLNGFVI